MQKNRNLLAWRSVSQRSAHQALRSLLWVALGALVVPTAARAQTRAGAGANAGSSQIFVRVKGGAAVDAAYTEPGIDGLILRLDPALSLDFGIRGQQGMGLAVSWMGQPYSRYGLYFAGVTPSYGVSTSRGLLTFGMGIGVLDVRDGLVDLVDLGDYDDALGLAPGVDFGIPLGERLSVDLGVTCYIGIGGPRPRDTNPALYPSEPTVQMLMPTAGVTYRF